jgi:hypothetical protein
MNSRSPCLGIMTRRPIRMAGTLPERMAAFIVLLETLSVSAASSMLRATRSSVFFNWAVTETNRATAYAAAQAALERTHLPHLAASFRRLRRVDSHSAH